ncbi:hypothetical protein ACN6LF_004674 [[Kitasatospora] papulosa]|uniref:hypothetical protein n=1 Tax=[Kitasatospora] papulosa TaxID=1464011 RepID=UPI0038092D89
MVKEPADAPPVRQTARTTQAPRVYGTEHDAPTTGPQPGHTYRELVGGPLDGQLIEVTGWTDEEITTGAQLITPHSAYRAGGRASYGHTFSRLDGPWAWERRCPVITRRPSSRPR